MPKEIEYIYRNPLLFLMIASGWVFSAVINFMTSAAPFLEKTNEQVLDAHKQTIQLQLELNHLVTQEVTNIKPVLQQFVNAQDKPSWVKLLNHNTQLFTYVVVNQHYSDAYGTPFVVIGKTDIEAYEDRNLTPEQISYLLTYEVNDRKAIRLGAGKCIIVTEPAFKIGMEMAFLQFKKCMLVSHNLVYVWGVEL